MKADHVHVSDLRWDRLLAGELDDATKVELLAATATCPTCATRHAELIRERDSFVERPPFVPRRAARSRRWIAMPVLLAAVGAIMIAVRARQEPQRPADRLKGAGPVLVVEAGAQAQLAPIASGDRIRPGDYVQAGYSAGRAGFGAVLGRDGRGQTSVYVPSRGDTMVALPAGTLRSFPESTVLDGVLGDEVLIVVWCEAARPLAALAAELDARGDIAEHDGCWHRRIVLIKQVWPP